MLSTRWTIAIIVLAVTASALGLFGDRNVETTVLLAGLAAILGILTVAVLLLAEMVDAVQALVRDHSSNHHHESGKQYDDDVALAPHAHHLRMVIAAVESVSRSKTLGGVIATRHSTLERHGKLTNVQAVGNYIDIFIPSDRHE
jgi:hypothetical protein